MSRDIDYVEASLVLEEARKDILRMITTIREIGLPQGDTVDNLRQASLSMAIELSNVKGEASRQTKEEDERAHRDYHSSVL